MPIQIVQDQGDFGFLYPKNPRVQLIPDIATLFKSNAEILRQLGPNQRTNIFYCLAHYSGLETARDAIRHAGAFGMQTVLAFDIDGVDKQRALEYAAIVADHLKCPTSNLIVVSTGQGLHVLTHLKVPITSIEYFKENRLAYGELIRKISAAIRSAELPFDKMDNILDAARVLRLPGTKNVKPGRPDTYCELVQYSDATLDVDLKDLSGIGDLEKENIAPEVVRRQYPTPDFAAVTAGCNFIQWCLNSPHNVHEPQFFALLSFLSAMPIESRITHQEQSLSPKELAKWVFERASASPSLKRTDFDLKWKQAINYGVRKCSTIASQWEQGCEGCVYRDKIPTPVAIKSKEHISSKNLGYWILNKDGQCSRPHYEDLVKVFKAETPYCTTSEGRLLAFDKRAYTEYTSHLVKSWLESTVVPSEPLMDRHCMEFVRKVERNGGMSLEREQEIFEASLIGKINCQNGVLDILTGELLPHSPDFGFRYVLPYDYEKSEGSEIFLDWLATITMDRPELMETLLDVMAYALWPTYDDHVFTFFSGTGKNGKSTLIHLMQALVGVKNFSAISLQQLASNRFAAANLEGKLLNASEESSGYELDIEESNIIKAISSGSEVQVERKGQDPFLFKNRAKLIFSTNHNPKFKDQTPSFLRRFLVVPFNYEIQEMDPNVELNLLAEVPKIMPMLVERIQKNIAVNGGRFKISRGGIVTREAQEKILKAGDSVCEWAEETLDSSMDIPNTDYVLCSEIFKEYLQWCEENGIKYRKSRQAFSSTLSQHVLHPQAKFSTSIRVGAGFVRVFKHVRRKEKIG